MRFLPVEEADRAEAVHITYQLLIERPPEANITHQRFVGMEDHEDFFDHHPYRHWFLLMTDDTSHPKKDQEVCVGSLYITPDDEIGIFILQEHQRRGYAREAILQAITHEKPRHRDRFVANVNPRNQASIDLFKSIGSFHIQNVYALPKP